MNSSEFHVGRHLRLIALLGRSNGQKDIYRFNHMCRHKTFDHASFACVESGKSSFSFLLAESEE